MPLTSVCNDNEIVLANDLSEADRASNYYFCRHCGAELKLVLPKKNIINHFRHLPNADCIYGSESMKHLAAKMFFYNTYKKDSLYERVEIESVWNGIEQDRRGDVVLYPKGRNIKPTVVEIQNSSISDDEIISRFVDWNAFDVSSDGLFAMMWVITDNVIDPTYTNKEISVPAWVRTLHKMYMGRVYIYSNDNIYAAHLDSVCRHSDWTGGTYYLKTKKYANVRKINSYNILQTNSGGGEYGDNRMISRFYDKKFW